MPHHKHCQVRGTIIPLVRSKSSPPRKNDIARPPAVIDRQQQAKKKRYPGGLAHVVSDVFYRVAANQRQPNLYRIGGGCTQFVHGHSRMTIDPRIPTMPGRSTSGFQQPGRHRLHHARSAVGCSVSRMKGELHPSKNRSEDGLRHLVLIFLLMDDSDQ